jgi:uncharacterized membrane protein (UPF0127 family)
MLYKLPFSNDSVLKIGIATTPEDRHQGLSGLSRLGKGKGLLITFDEIRKNWDIVNRDMNFPIDVIGLRINDKKTSARVTGIFSLTKFTGDRVSALKAGEELETLADDSKEAPYDTVYVSGNAVLEINKGVAKDTGLEVGDVIGLTEEITKTIPKYSGEEEPSPQMASRAGKDGEANPMNNSLHKKFQFGGAMDLETDIEYNGVSIKEKDVKLDKSKMQILDDMGVIQMNIAGGNRIFSRQHTKLLMELIDKAENDNDLENLGRILVTILDLHDNQPEDYVDE